MHVTSLQKNLQKSVHSLLLLVLFGLVVYAEVETPKIVVDITIPENYKKVEAGSYFLVPVEILLITEEQKKLDLLIEYTIKDPNGDSLFKLSETKAAKERLTTVREFRIPEKSRLGIYTIEVKTSYINHSSTNTAMFEVVKSRTLGTKEITDLQEDVTILASSFVLAVLFFLIHVWYEYRRFKRLGERYKIREKDLKNEDIWR